MENQNGNFNTQGNNPGGTFYGYQSQQSRNGYASQNGNNAFQSFVIQKDPFLNSEAKHITKLSILAGAAILSFLGLQNIMSVVLNLLGLSKLYMSNYSFQMIFGTLCTIVCIFIPFAIIYGLYSTGDKEKCLEFGAPVSWKAFGFAVPAGLMVCCIADYISSGFSCFAGEFGVSFIDIETKTPSNVFEFLLMVLECAIVPALCEEFAIRGVIMQPLRRYGDRFAIVMSSVIFAIMHGNMMQIPVALIAGFALGYFAIATNSIWTGVAIHFANNLLAVILTTLNSGITIDSGFSFASVMSTVIMAAAIAAGIFCLIKFIKTEHNGIGLTFGPKAEKLYFLCAAAAFTVFSFFISMFGVVIPIFYIGSAAVTVAFFFIYRNENKKMLNAPPITGLTDKLMKSLYFGSPTVILAAYSLLITTINLISLDGIGSYFFCFLLFVLYYIVSISAVSHVKNSLLLENKKAYKFSVFVLAASAVFTLIFMVTLLFR